MSYSASKAAVSLLTRAIASYFITHGIAATPSAPARWKRHRCCSAPRRQARTEREKFVARQKMGRLGTAEEIASIAVYLASDEAAFTTGVDLVVDGGYML